MKRRLGSMLKVRVRSFSQSDAHEVYTVLHNTEELHVGGLTYSESVVQGWHVIRAEDVLLIAEVEEVTTGFAATRLNDPESRAAYIDCLVVRAQAVFNSFFERLCTHMLLISV